MKIYRDQTVLDASLERLRYLFSKFNNVVVFFSGGKDSTTILELTLIVAREQSRLPVKVMFIDQEGEWDATDEYVSEVMHRDEVEPYWLQCPIRLANATSATDNWLHCWEEGVEWIRPKSDISIHENVYGEDRFKNMFNAFARYMFPTAPVACIGGVRAQESPARSVSLTTVAKYEHVTWAKVLNGKLSHYTFYPIYDWEIHDIWKFIHDGGYRYNRIYDRMWQHGLKIEKMRVSNLHHESAVSSLFILQELEPDTWTRVQRRLRGVNTAGQLGESDYFVGEVPSMFANAREYRDYLLENLIPDGEEKDRFRRQFKAFDKVYEGYPSMEYIYLHEINAILVNDSFMVKIGNLSSSTGLYKWKHLANSMRSGR